jgi:hypothetical protein
MAGERTQGRRLPDVVWGDLPEGDIQPGDYWKFVLDDGTPLHVAESPGNGNLTGTSWGLMAPNSDAIGTLRLHTVRENEDGTASILPGDGSSNSVSITGPGGLNWHGYLYNGVWESV